jgi:hypothetical protein
LLVEEFLGQGLVPLELLDLQEGAEGVYELVLRDLPVFVSKDLLVMELLGQCLVPVVLLLEGLEEVELDQPFVDRLVLVFAVLPFVGHLLFLGFGWLQMVVLDELVLREPLEALELELQEAVEPLVFEPASFAAADLL